MITIAILVAAAGPQALPSATEGVAVNSMWEYMGAMSHARCLVAEMKTIPADSQSLRDAEQRAVQRCRDKFLNGAKFNGGSWPGPLLQQAKAMMPKVEGDLLPVFSRLGPSEQATIDRVHIMVTNDDGDMFNTLTEKNAKLSLPMRLYAAFQSAISSDDEVSDAQD